MPITFSCPYPNCSRIFTNVNEQRAGNTANCPDCGKPVTVPTQEILAWFQTQEIEFGIAKYGETLMHKAAKTGRVDVMIWLKRHGDEGINARDDTFLTPIYYAVSEGHVAAMDWLKKQNADFTANDRFESLVFSAARNGHINALEYLKEVCNIPLDTIHPKSESSLIAFAAHGGHVGVMQWLVDCRATKAKVKDKDSQTLYFDAIRGGHIEVMDWLYQQKVNINEPDKRRKTPIFIAAHCGQVGMMQWLKDHGAKLHLTDENGETPMTWAKNGITLISRDDGHNGKDNAIKWLRDNGVVDMSSYKDILKAAERGDVSDVKYFVEYKGVNINTSDSDGWTPLYFAALHNNNVEVMKYLISKGANVHAKSMNNYGSYDASLLYSDRLSEERKRILRAAADRSGCLVFLAVLGGLLTSGVCGLVFAVFSFLR